MEFKKSKLRQLKRIYATPVMIKRAKKEEVHRLYARCQSRSGLLMVCIFDVSEMKKGIKEPVYEIYINPESDQWITWIQPQGQSGKWSEAMLENLGLVRTNWWSYPNGKRENIIWQNQEGKAEIKHYLKTEQSGWLGIVEWQKKCREEKIARQEERQQIPWDEDMKLIGPVSQAFRRWMTKEAVKEWFIFYESTRGGAKEGYCTHCQKKVPLKIKPKHNMDGICPKCKKRITYKVAGRIGSTETMWHTGRMMECIEGGLVERFFDEKHFYHQKKGYMNPSIVFNESKRILYFDDGRIKIYEYELYKNKKLRWVEKKDYHPGTTFYRYRNIMQYERNLKKIKKKTERSSYWQWEKKPDIALGDYLYYERKRPAVELTAKVGLYRIAKEIMDNDWRYDQYIDAKGTDLQTVLKLDKARIKRLKAMDGNVDMVRWLQLEKMADTIWPDEMIKDLSELDTYRQSNVFGFLKPPLNYPKLWRYAKRQQMISGLTFSAVIREWDDYISMAGTMKMDISKEQIWKPKNIKEAHDNLIKLREQDGAEKLAKNLRKKWPKVEENLKALKKFEYKEKDFCIVAPEKMEDIVWEGILLSHCIHTCDFYFERITNKETYLFFLRRTSREDSPWYTLEVEQSGNIRQKRTVGDNQNEDLQEAIPFLKRFQEHFVNSMTKQEKALGKKADKKRKEEYKQLRVDGNKVWHGKLAGQLLADVLEKDFMEVG